MANEKWCNSMENTITAKKSIYLSGRVLATAALLGTGLLYIANFHSAPFIKANERAVLLDSLNAVIEKDQYDNDIINDKIYVKNKKYLGTETGMPIYRARKNNQPVAAVLTVIAPNGYSGKITLLVGINIENLVTAVRVVKHKETPGLGDAIEKQRSNWIDIFMGKSTTNPESRKWKVKRDGGEFDQLTGATITPRAIVSAVYHSLQYFEQNKATIFKNPEE